MPRSWRLVDSGLVAPPVSAALDEAILESHIAGRSPDTLHLYVRSSPTVSIGYFQKVADSVDAGECHRRGVSLVRRRSGGSSIYTDSGQLIYGLVFHENDLPRDRLESFRVICTGIANSLRIFGVDAVYRPVNDVEVGGKKISGSAQLRRKGSVLQHGTIIVNTDLAQMDAVLKAGAGTRRQIMRPSERVTTLRGLLGQAPDMETVKRALATALGDSLGVSFSVSHLSEYEESLVKSLVSECYSRNEWNMRI